MKLKINLSLRPDGSGVLHCTRADGSVTWAKREKHAAFFALHDLTHVAVETELAYRRGFFGLIAEGWDIEDTTGKGKRGPLPEEAGVVEQMVGLFDREQSSGAFPAREFNQFTAPRVFSEQDLARVRTLKTKLAKEWFHLNSVGAIMIGFTPGVPISAG